jgi:hypothetical protein
VRTAGAEHIVFQAVNVIAHTCPHPVVPIAGSSDRLTAGTGDRGDMAGLKEGKTDWTLRLSCFSFLFGRDPAHGWLVVVVV